MIKNQERFCDVPWWYEKLTPPHSTKIRWFWFIFLPFVQQPLLCSYPLTQFGGLWKDPWPPQPLATGSSTNMGMDEEAQIASRVSLGMVGKTPMLMTLTLPETNQNAPENRPGPKRKIIFQPSTFRAKMLVSGSVTMGETFWHVGVVPLIRNDTIKFYKLVLHVWLWLVGGERILLENPDPLEKEASLPAFQTHPPCPDFSCMISSLLCPRETTSIQFLSHPIPPPKKFVY